MGSNPFDGDPDDERRHFEEAMRDVVPLRKDHRVGVRVTTRVPQPPHSPHRTPPERARDDEPDGIEDDSGYVANGVDRRELRKLKRGSYVPGRRLDLHGMTSKAAVAEVNRFLETSRRAFRCVAIVHGRGLHSEGNVAVLRTTVRARLRSHRAVLAYTDAPRDDGGAGAVYVLLRA
jgi:DNA-nicking Smr family endonuclease